MLKKLLKYEFSAVGRVMLPLYGLVLALGMLFGVMMRVSDNGDLYRVSNVASGSLYGGMCAVMLIVALVLVIQRFYKNLLGTEGYLMFSLPVTTGQHIAGKGIVAVVSIALAAVVGFCSVVLMALIWEGKDTLNFAFLSRWQEFHTFTSAQFTLLIVEMVILFLFSCLVIVIKIYAAIAAGHQWSNHRAAGSVLAFVGYSVVEAVLASNVFLGEHSLLITLLDQTSIQRWLTSLHTFGLAQLYCATWAAPVAVLIAIYWLITWRLLSRRLNLQ